MEATESSSRHLVPLMHRLKFHSRNVLVWSWGALGVLLLIAFFLPNYRIATVEKTGLDVVMLVFQDTSHIRNMTSEGSYLLMVAVPVCNLLLGITAILAAIRTWWNKGKTLAMAVTGAGLVVLVLSILGLSVIGDPGDQILFVAKFLPRPIFGYHLAVVWESLLLIAGILYHVVNLQAAIRGPQENLTSN